MGLDMYLYRMKKTQKAELDAIHKEIDDLNKHYDEFYKSLPLLEGSDWEFDESKFTEEQKTKLQESRDMFKALFNKESELCNSLKGQYPETTESYGGSYMYWRKFGALHSYIVDEFANGVDECQEIPLSKYAIEHIILSLKETKDVLDKGTKVESKEYPGYYTIKVDENSLKMRPTSVGACPLIDIDKWFYEYVSTSIEKFEFLLNDLKDDEVVYYEASW